MRILGVRLRNIRSYVDKVVVFSPSRTTVIYGDNGAGKTSILLGINYALFGLPRGQKGSDLFAGFVSPYKEDLLRVGASSATVRLLIEHRGKLMLIERRLNGDRGGRIVIFSSTGDSLKVESSRNYSSEDLTKKILELLGLKEDPRKSRSTYIFSNVMYVPQFNVHQTLMLDDGQRRELVDRVLGLDKYMTALTNIEKIAKGKNSVIGRELHVINERIKDYEKHLREININEIREELSRLVSKREELNKKLNELRARRESLEGERKRLSEVMSEKLQKMGELKSRLESINRAKAELGDKKEKLNKILSEVGFSSIDRPNELVEELRTRKLNLENEYSKTSKELEQLSKKLKDIESDEKDILTHASRLEAKIEEIKSRVKEIQSEVKETKSIVAQGVCPLCKQSITHEHGEELVREKYVRMREVAMKIAPLAKDLRSARDHLKGLRNDKEEITKKMTELNKKIEEIEASVRRLSQAIELSEELSKRISDLEQEVLEENKVLEELHNVKVDIEDHKKEEEKLNKAIDEIKRVENEYNREVGRISERISNLEKELERYNKLSSELRELESRASVLNKVADYLDNHIYKGVEAIENALRGLAHDRFSEYFQEYFLKLLEDQELVEASVSDFKPVVRVRTGAAGGQEISQPSGAQLTALGLAYRLALNRVVRDLNKELRESVLIMDEPTLGFSPERVEKLRELIEYVGGGLGKAQVILVTHDERLLEVGDCRIRLSIDQSRNETLVNYEECFIESGDVDFQRYRDFVSSMLLK